MVTTLALYSVTSGALALFVHQFPSPTRCPNFSTVYFRFQPLSLYVSTVILASPILLTEFMYQYTLYPRTLIYVVSFFTLVHVYACAFMAMSVHTSPILYFTLTLTDTTTPL